jgi:hypothetical protein
MSKPVGYSTIGPISVPDKLKEMFRDACKEKHVFMEDATVDCILDFVCEAHPEAADELHQLVKRTGSA